MNIDSFTNRLNESFASSGIKTKADFAAALDISPQYLNKLMKGNAQSLPPADLVNKMSEALNVNLIWLITGIGSKDAVHNVMIGDPASDERCIPVLAYDIEFSCGGGCPQASYEQADEAPVYYKESWFYKHGVQPENVRRLRCHGDSMEPVILDGDYITVDTSAEARTHIQNNKIYAIWHDDSLFCKYLIKLLNNEGYIIRSANPAYPDQTVKGEALNYDLVIIGRVLDRSGDIS